MAWCRSSSKLNAQTDDWREAEIARAKKLLAKGEDVDAVLDALSRGLTQKMMHGTMAALHKGSEHDAPRPWTPSPTCSCAPPQPQVSYALCAAFAASREAKNRLSALYLASALPATHLRQHLSLLSHAHHETFSAHPAGALRPAPGRTGLFAFARRHHGRHAEVPHASRANTRM